MTTTSTAPAMERQPRFASLLALVMFVSVVGALGIVIATTMLQSDHVTTTREARHTTYGFPIAWVTQDQSVFVQKPSLPTNATMASPLENPTSFSARAVAADLAILGLSPIVLFLFGHAVLVRRRRQPMRPMTPATA